MSNRTVAETQDEWIALPLHDCPKSKLREMGVPGPLVRAVRAASTVEDLRPLDLDPALRKRLEVRLLQRVAARNRSGHSAKHLHLAFNQEHLSDLRQELVEILIALDSKQLETVDRVMCGGSQRIRGVAGSGKTQILLHALAKRLYHSPTTSDLLWTYNRNLSDMAVSLLGRIAGPRGSRAVVDTFDRWCLRYHGRTRVILKDEHEELTALLGQARDQARAASTDPGSRIWMRDGEFWRHEVNYVRDQPLESLEEYLQVDRAGRGTRLDRGHRQMVWSVYENYSQLLESRGLGDWRAARLDAYRKLLATRSSRYDRVFIDEAQDLPPLALRMAALLSGDNVTLALDGAQAIYRKGFCWRSIGLGQARTTTLDNCYRTTTQIARAAEPFRVREDELIAWSVDRHGPKPRVVDVAPPALEAEWVAQDIVRRLSAQEIAPGHVAVLAYSRKLVHGVAARLRERGIQVADGVLDLSDETVKVLTMSSAKGLEFPLVYIAPLWDDEFFPRQRGQDDDEHRLETERRMKVLYVAMTRAKQELILVHRRGRAARVIERLNPDRIQQERGVVRGD